MYSCVLLIGTLLPAVWVFTARAPVCCAMHVAVLDGPVKCLQEIVPVEVPGRRGHLPTVIGRDEAPSKFRQDKLQQLRPAFSDGSEPGSVTAGNASPITDGAAALVLASASAAQQRGLKASHVPALTCRCSTCCSLLIAHVPLR